MKVERGREKRGRKRDMRGPSAGASDHIPEYIQVPSTGITERAHAQQNDDGLDTLVYLTDASHTLIHAAFEWSAVPVAFYF